MPTPPPSALLQRLSRSPSPSSSLTSCSSFDPHSSLPPSPPGTAGERPTLGLRELTRMAIDDRKAIKARRGLASGVASAPTSTRNSLDVGRRIEVRRGSDQELGFARDVNIRGWKVVGGSRWNDVGKVGAYVVYDIEIITVSGGTISILRRYTDFVKLRQSLKAHYPHMRQAIPTLPSKAHMAKFSEKFLADRQVRLQRFLRSIMLHPEMGRAGVGSVVGEWVLEPERRPSGS